LLAYSFVPKTINLIDNRLFGGSFLPSILVTTNPRHLATISPSLVLNRTELTEITYLSAGHYIILIIFVKINVELFFTFCTKQLVTEKSKPIKFLYKMKNTYYVLAISKVKFRDLIFILNNLCICTWKRLEQI